MQCVVSNCSHDSNSAISQGVTFHLFPLEPSLRETWLSALNKKGWSPTKESSVCSDHFFINDLYLNECGRCKVKEGAVPIAQKQDVSNRDKLVPCDVKVCRICFSTDCNLYSMKLFKNLNEAYRTLMGRLIENEDKIPPYLCSECSHQLINCSKFKNKILQAYLALEEILRKHDCITQESIENVYENHDLVKSKCGSTNNEIFHCNIQVELVKNEKMDTDDQTDQTDLQSPHEHFIVEGIKKEKEDILNPASPKDITNDIVYSPIFHKYIVPDGIKTEEGKPDRLHYQETNYDMMHGNAFVGENYSAEVLQEAEEMAIRIADSVENLTKIPLNSIHPMFDNHPKSLLEADMRPTNDNLSSHIHSDESSEKPFTCNICKKSFSQKSWLMTHLRIHSGERPYLCDTCKKTFNDKSNYRKHLRIHSGEKPFPCTFCDKTFNRKNYLENHLRTHSGEKPYSCGICNKVFGHKHHLKSHLRIHSGEKPYQCYICKKQFSEKSNLHMHLKVHSGDRLYSCEVCKIAFSTKYLLKCHSKVHTEKSNEIIKLLNRPSGNVPI